MTAELGDLRVALLEIGELAFPRGVVRIKMRQIPAVGLGDIVAGGDASDGLRSFGGSKNHARDCARLRIPSN